MSLQTKDTMAAYMTTAARAYQSNVQIAQQWFGILFPGVVKAGVNPQSAVLSKQNDEQVQQTKDLVAEFGTDAVVLVGFLKEVIAAIAVYESGRKITPPARPWQVNGLAAGYTFTENADGSIAPTYTAPA